MSIHHTITPKAMTYIGTSREDSADAQLDALEAALADLAAALSDDFANGRVGMRHNTYGHRSRVIRQIEGRLVAMRASNATLVS